MTAINFASSPDPILAQALSVLTTRIYLQINPAALDLCKPAIFIPPEKAPMLLRSPAERGSFVTWSPLGAKMFTLIRVNAESLVYCHDNDTLYLASPQATLSMKSPNNVAFLAQYFQENNEQRLLVFDMVSPPTTDAKPTNPAQRGDTLRSLSYVFPHPLMAVQWVGFVDPLRVFAKTLPHQVSSFMELTTDPFQIIKFDPY